MKNGGTGFQPVLAQADMFVPDPIGVRGFLSSWVLDTFIKSWLNWFSPFGGIKSCEFLGEALSFIPQGPWRETAPSPECGRRGPLGKTGERRLLPAP